MESNARGIFDYVTTRLIFPRDRIIFYSSNLSIDPVTVKRVSTVRKSKIGDDSESNIFLLWAQQNCENRREKEQTFCERIG